MNNEDDERDGDVEDEGGIAQIRRREVTYGSHLVQGKMNHGMEDYIVTEDRLVDDHKLGLFAIFDGHSGRDVAEYLQSHLFDNILSQVLKRKPLERRFNITAVSLLNMVCHFL